MPRSLALRRRGSRKDFPYRCTFGTKKEILSAEIIDGGKFVRVRICESALSHKEFYNVKLSADIVVRIGWEICRRQFII